MFSRFLRIVMLSALVLALVPSLAMGADDFFKGKTIRFVVGFSPGGGFDTYTRLIARHIGKHVPGNPRTVVQNRTGAGSMIAANYIYNRAKPDGLTVGNWIGPLVLQHVLGKKGIRFDGRKFNWLGVPVNDDNTCALTKASGINSIEDWINSKRPIKIGATAPGSTTDDVPKLVKAATGLPMQIIEGYSGTAIIRLAAERGEVDGGCWAWQSIKPTWAQGIESGNVKPILQISAKRHPDLPNIALAGSLAKGERGKKLMRVATDVYASISRPYSLPPGVPADRVKTLQKAFMDAMNDPELKADAKKSKLELNPHDGNWVAEKMKGLYDTDAATVSLLKEVLSPKK
jgi:tripartite-type tricarboxylate transporter receptor subunit TctC